MCIKKQTKKYLNPNISFVFRLKTKNDYNAEEKILFLGKSRNIVSSCETTAVLNNTFRNFIKI